MATQATLRPSSLPKLKECPCFEPQAGGETAERGTLRHRALSGFFAGVAVETVEELTPQEKEGVNWAARYIVDTATTSEALRFEHSLTLRDDDFNALMTGTPDVVCGPDLYDLKWAWANYDEQLVAYALMRMDETGLDAIHCHILFADSKQVRTFTVYRSDAERIIDDIVTRWRKRKEGDENPGDACNYCAIKLKCKALNTGALEVNAGADWRLSAYDPTKLADPAELAKALDIARALEKWAEAVKAEADRRAVDCGEELPGNRVVSRDGNRYFADANRTHRDLDLPLEKFLPCVKVSFSSVVRAYMETHGCTEAEAERAIAEKSADNLRRGLPTKFLQKIKTNKRKSLP